MAPELHALHQALWDARQTHGGGWGLACSGGADSLALVHAAQAVLPHGDFAVLHVDHQLQAGSAAVAAQVAAWCNARGLRFIGLRVDVPRGASVEAQARAVRYEALVAACRDAQLAWLVTAHHAEDQAETLLLRLLRGTGPSGLAAMAVRTGRVLRPWLHQPQARIAAYAAEHALPVWHDPMNADMRYTRARLRHQLLPALRQENPNLVAHLGALAEEMGGWRGQMDELARACLGASPYTVAALHGVAPVVRRHALTLALTDAGVPVSQVALHRMERLLAVSHGSQTAVVAGGYVHRCYGEWTVHAGAPLVVNQPGPIEARGYLLRAWRPGERFRPVRLAGHSKKISDLLGEAKIGAAARRGLRVLERTSDGALVWLECIGRAYGENVEIEAVLDDLMRGEPETAKILG